MRKARQSATEIGAFKLCVFGHCSRQEAFAQRAVPHEADSEFLDRGNDFLLGSSCPQRVFALESSHRLNGVRATDRLRACLGESEVLDLA